MSKSKKEKERMAIEVFLNPPVKRGRISYPAPCVGDVQFVQIKRQGAQHPPPTSLWARPAHSITLCSSATAAARGGEQTKTTRGNESIRVQLGSALGRLRSGSSFDWGQQLVCCFGVSRVL